MRTTTLTLAALALFATACAKTDSANAAADSAKPMAGMEGDVDASPNGSGVPQGYTAMTDKADADVAGAKYTVTGGNWEVQTGPAHILYAPADSASGVYAVTTTIAQLEKPRHPEAYGIFFGGQHLDDRAAQRYGYFIVRGTGEYLIKVRDGDKTTSVVNWTASPDVPKEDASGKASYDLKVHFAPDTAHFTVNGKLVAAVPKKDLPSEGVAGLRINHNLHLTVKPVAVSK
ncbi:MAG TPA: hypothetical protein VIQ74_17015 [Gemmatimonadaceae bacterium]